MGSVAASEVIVGSVVAVALFVLIFGLLFTIGWNVGAVALITSVGGTATMITPFEGMGIALLVSLSFGFLTAIAKAARGDR